MEVNYWQVWFPVGHVVGQERVIHVIHLTWTP
jgi:hypothetical protein